MLGLLSWPGWLRCDGFHETPAQAWPSLQLAEPKEALGEGQGVCYVRQWAVCFNLLFWYQGVGGAGWGGGWLGGRERRRKEEGENIIDLGRILQRLIYESSKTKKLEIKTCQAVTKKLHLV